MKLISPGALSRFGMLGINARNLDFIGRYNQREQYPLVDNKLKTKMIAQEHQLAVPALRFSLTQQHDVEATIQQLDTMSGFAMKPAKGSGGRGIWVITDRRDGKFVKSSGIVVDHDDLRRHMSNTLAGLYSLGGGADSVIIEDLIQLDPRFDGLSVEGIPDIRVIVFKGYPVMAMLRLATHQSDGKANLHQGAVGVGLTLEEGHYANAVQNGHPIQEHPDTQKPLNQIAIPEWPTILYLAAQCFEVTGLGYLGTDIVIDRDRGPVLLELNARPGLAIQLANNCGLLPRLRHIEGLRETPRRDAADRVHYSIEKLSKL
ncbi:putative alpha-L-glutamate ligase [Luminiphilus syltensis NOR5-1B]|uniref:Putative alpha-L-glutamate ligase n=1 Tax=Luminiphilus syltensis NOR5-1B TaxID=565045 RepID=B8KVD1_9GAMM|nr:alpha-L-glutamate ligase-like protein [Luminiphilus syltensis]EED34191.1 putative alpha-L-glutamate ligase [Luminiphilus syltensis NOR5-1B]